LKYSTQKKVTKLKYLNYTEMERKKLFKKLYEIIGLVMHKQITAQNLPILKQEWYGRCPNAKSGDKPRGA
jgi:hypothetical protein